MVVVVKADPKSAQAQMRHATTGPTLDIYAQMVKDEQRQAVRKMKTDMDREKRSRTSVARKIVPIKSQLEQFGT